VGTGQIIPPVLALAATAIAAAFALAAADGGTPGTGVDGRPMPAEWEDDRNQQVIVRRGARLRWRVGEEPRPGGPQHCCSEREPPGTAFGARAPSREGRLYLVEIPGRDQQPRWACHELARGGEFNRLEQYRLRFWVAEGDLQPVTRREVQRREPDGSGLWLRRGLPLERVGDGGTHWRAKDGDLELEVSLAGDEVGLIYAPQPFRSSEERARRWDEAHRLKDDHLLTASEGTIGDAGIARFPPGDSIDRAQRVGGGYLVPVEGRRTCAEARVRVPARALRKLREGEGFSGSVEGGVIGGVTSHRPILWDAVAGARVYWPDGSRAGSLLDDDQLINDPVRSASGHLCFQVRLEGTANALPLCFEPEEVAREEEGP
jgi:hypothetical protein